MEIICRILDQGALTTRQYPDKNGQIQTITTMPFVLASGSDTIFAEMTGEAATKCGPCSKDYYYKAELSFRVTQFNTKDGELVKKNQCYINRISVL